MNSLAIQDALLIMLKRMCIFPGRIIIQTALYNLKWSPEMTETENIMTPDRAIAQMQILYHIKIKYVPNTSPPGSPPMYTLSPCLESSHNDTCATSEIQMKDKCDSSAYVHKVDGIHQNQNEKRDKHEHTDTVPSIPNESGPPHESYKLGSQVYGPTPILSKEKSDQMHEDKNTR